ncbi:Leucine rich repeat/Leucine Rich repeats (2 copies)/Leucine Rich Repeat [Novymonas esmeraldas]|uniref:Leucine rich repeat/Leucine Rich repeats (2 copies)/Leucine Rich Repeat n=1 Tax=Novymonas esmeraldas TaxID=1808958 RepID=A0AAW0EMJ9_9TRYP
MTTTASSSRGSAQSEEVEVSGRGRGIRAIDLPVVFATPHEQQMLSVITAFDVSRNELTALTDLHPLRSLARLNASYNRISVIAGLPLRLTQLNLSHNRLDHLDHVGQLMHLRELDVSGNRLTSLAGLHPRLPLEVLRADDNRVHRTTGLEGLPRLRVLSLANNYIADVDELMFASTTPSLQLLQLVGNPVARVRRYRQTLAELQPALVSLDGAPLTRGTDRPDTPERRPTSQAAVEAPPEPQPQRAPLPRPQTTTASLRGAAAVGDVDTRPRPSPPPPPPPARASHPPAPPAAAAAATAAAAGVARRNPVRRAAHGSSLSTAVAEHRDDSTADVDPSVDVVADSVADVRTPELQRRQGSGYAVLHASPGVGTAERRRGGWQAGGSTTPASRSVSDQRELDAATAQLHDSLVAQEQREKECHALRGLCKRTEAQLAEARRVISRQLAELSQLRLERDALRESEGSVLERLEREKRASRARAAHHSEEVATLQAQYERLKTFYEAQLADTRRELSAERARLLRRDHGSVEVAAAAAAAPTRARKSDNTETAPPTRTAFPASHPGGGAITQQLHTRRHTSPDDASAAAATAVASALERVQSTPPLPLDDAATAAAARRMLEAFITQHTTALPMKSEDSVAATVASAPALADECESAASPVHGDCEGLRRAPDDEAEAVEQHEPPPPQQQQQQPSALTVVDVCDADASESDTDVTVLVSAPAAPLIHRAPPSHDVRVSAAKALLKGMEALFDD